MSYISVTLVSSRYFMSINVPLLFWHISIMFPTYSLGVIIFAVTIGSSMYAISACGGKSTGLYMSNISPEVLWTL